MQLSFLVLNALVSCGNCILHAIPSQLPTNHIVTEEDGVVIMHLLMETQVKNDCALRAPTNDE